MQGSLRKRNDKWYYSFELTSTGGKRRRIERVGGRTKKEAEQAMRRAMTEFENTGRIFEPSEISFSDYIEYWLKEYVALNLKPNTHDTYAVLFKTKIKPVFDNYKLMAITTPLLQKFFNDLFRTGTPRNTFDVLYAILSGAFKYAHLTCGYINENPIKNVIKPKYKAAPKQSKALSTEMIKEIFAQVSNSEYYIPFIISYYTGLRAAECLGLTWDDINFDDHTLTVDKILIARHELRFGPPKTSTSYRTIPISDKLLTILRKQKPEQAKQKLRYGAYYTNYHLNEDKSISTGVGEPPIHFICTHENGKVITYPKIFAIVDNIRTKLNIDFTFHNLRHTHATLLIEGGANPKEVQERLGHSNFSTTMNTYVHTTEKMKTQTVKIFDNVDIL